MRIKVGQDFASGLLFVAVGLAGLWLGADYPMGTAQRPGTGVLPYILCWCLIGTGGLLIIKSIFAGGAAIEGWSWRPILAITAGTVVFGMMIDDYGLVATMIRNTTTMTARMMRIFFSIIVGVTFLRVPRTATQGTT